MLRKFIHGAAAGAKRGAFYLTIIFVALWAVLAIVALVIGTPIELLLINAVLGISISGVLQGAFFGAIIGGVRALNEHDNPSGQPRVSSWLITGGVLGLLFGILLGTAVSLIIGEINQVFSVIFTAISTGVIVGGLGGGLIGIIRKKARG